VIGVGVGVGELLILRSKESDLTSNGCQVDSSHLTANSDQCASLATSRDQARVGTIIGFSAAGALAITSTVLFLTSSSSSSHSSSAFVCVPSFLTASATCQLRF